MSKYKKLIFIFAIALLLNSCGGAKDFLTNTKKPAGDEFLVEKKQPLTMPPNFEDIPVPITDEERTSEINETDQVEIEELLKNSPDKFGDFFKVPPIIKGKKKSK